MVTTNSQNAHCTDVMSLPNESHFEIARHIWPWEDTHGLMRTKEPTMRKSDL
jgi:hypothetical protein